ncbi:hypothetical protein AB0P17_36750 [Streptomyces sp. NPDC088124]|uniref:hypothetical protein n=1 Tax=Streptomyces sp. NPDC088124 TaxID=3154654 RepID=UPI00344AB728
MTNPLHGTDEIIAHPDRYVTSYGYEVGEPGHEKECATRIAQLLACPAPSAPRPKLETVR